MFYPLQCNPLWGKTKIGTSNATICRYGCTICSISCLLSWYGKELTPDELARTLEFTPDGKILWNSVNRQDWPMRFAYRLYSSDRGVIDGILKSKNLSCALEFSAYGAKHWCAALGFDRWNGAYRIFDPMNGIISSKKYGAPTGAAVFDRK